MKTLNQFLEQAEPAQEPQKEDPKVKQAQAKENMLKKRVLMTKIRAVRGGATGIMASHEPEGEMVDESKGHKYDDSFIEGETGSKTSRRNLTRAMSSTQIGMGKGARGKAEDTAKRRERHKADRGVKTRGTKAGHSGSAYPTKEKTLDDTYPHKKTARLKAKLAARKSGEKYKDDTHHSLKKKTVGEKLPKVNEGVMKFVKSIGRKKKEERTPQKAMDAGARLRRKVERKVHAKYVSGSEDLVPDNIREEDKAFAYVVDKLKKQHGDGVLTKGDKIKPPTAAQKKAAAAHRKKVDRENAAERAKDPSQGRYPPGYSNRGSD